MKTIRELLKEPATRDAEPAARLRQLFDDGTIVAWLHGNPGSGKNRVLLDFEQQVAPATIVTVDCRSVEPTHSGLARELDAADGGLDTAAARLSALAERVYIVFRNYEVFRLADGWLRRDFLPELGANVRIVLSSTEKPSAGWIGAAAWHRHFAVVGLDDADPEVAAQRMLDEVDDRALRALLEDLSVVRRITRPLLAALCPETDAHAAWDALSRLPFVEQQRDGLALSSVLQRELASRLQAADPERYRELQRRAWRRFREQLKSATHADLWRSTADTIFLIKNPVIREAFFPSASAPFSVDPAVAADIDEILDIVSRHEGAGAVDLTRLWWKHLPSSFHVVRDPSATIVGFYCAARADEPGNGWMRFDPVADAWLQHLARSAGAAHPESLFLRRWLSRDAGESPSGEQAAAWVDIKRTYLEMRPSLRRVYLTLNELGPYAAVATELGFRVLDEATVPLGDARYFTAMLDFGPGSVDGWICNLVAAELGIGHDRLLDAATRELLLDGQRIALTPLEYGVLSMLEARDGEPVTRQELLAEVWAQGDAAGSNVVDAVVRGLRKKCGDHAHILETVRGVGYRLQAS